MDASEQIVIDRPQKAVFEFMDVPENQQRISPRLSSVETVGTLDNGGKRATYTYRLFGLRFTGEVRGVEHEPPERIRFEMDGDIAGEIRWQFEPIDHGTRVTYSIDYDFDIPWLIDSLFGPAIDRFNQRELQATLDNLQRRM